METTEQKIARLQNAIAQLEVTMAKFGKSPTLQAIHKVKKDELEQTIKLGLQKANRPVIVQPPSTSWQNNLGLYIIITFAVLVIAGVVIFLITNSIP
jgi:hypothetical protein